MARKRKPPIKQVVTTEHAGENVWRPAFLASMAQHGNVTVSARAAGISRNAAYYAYNTDPEFASAWDAAYQEACDLIEAEALRRATRGTQKGIYYKGERVDTEVEYSDTLMLAMLKGHKPDKYGDKVTIRMSPDQLAILARFNLTPAQAMEDFVANLAAAEKEVVNE